MKLEENKYKELMLEELSDQDIKLIRDFIRREVALIFFDLYKKKNAWSL